MNRYDYSTAADYARLTGFDRTTIAAWIKAGKIGARGRHKKTKPKNSHYKISECEFRPGRIAAAKAKKPYPKHGKTYSAAELHVLQNNEHLSAHTIAFMIGRNENSVRIKRCRMRREEKQQNARARNTAS